MCKSLLPLKLLVNADAWQFGSKNETDVLYFLPPSHLFKKSFPRYYFMLASNKAYLLLFRTATLLLSPFVRNMSALPQPFCPCGHHIIFELYGTGEALNLLL